MTIRSPRTILAIMLILALVGVAGIAGYRLQQRQYLAKMLNIGKVPASVSAIDCASFGLTDVLERCAFKVAPSDFDSLLTGYRFDNMRACHADSPKSESCIATEAGPRTSHGYCCGPPVGGDFVIASEYGATPLEFEYGGHVAVIADRSRSQVMVDLYIE
jgi:hypothetical protein